MSNPFGGTYTRGLQAAPLVTAVDHRVLEKSTVRKLLTLLHPDHYKGHDPEMAAELFRFFTNYEAR